MSALDNLAALLLSQGDEDLTTCGYSIARACTSRAARWLGAADPRTGGVTVVQREGSAVNLNWLFRWCSEAHG